MPLKTSWLAPRSHRLTAAGILVISLAQAAAARVREGGQDAV